MLVALDSKAVATGKVFPAFLGGRFLGIMVLGAFIALFGWFVEIDQRTMLLVFALLSLLFGALVLLKPKKLAGLKLIRHCEVGGCGGCESLEAEQQAPEGHDCSSCHANGNCSHSAAGTAASLSSSAVALLGFVRGATPCLKVLLLAPLLLVLPFAEALLLTAVFALASSIYPLIGLLAGDILAVATSGKHKLQFTRVAAMMLVCIGLYYLYKFWTFSCERGL